MSPDDRSSSVVQLQARQRVELFAEITLKIRQSLQLPEILRTIVTEVQRVLQADRVLIYQVLPDGTGKPISEAVLQAVNSSLQQEIIDRQQIESALRQSEEQLRSIANALPVSIAYIDDRQCSQFNNRRC